MVGMDRNSAAALSTTAPDLAPAEVIALVRRLYGIDGSVESLAGERDQNCRVETADGSRYVIKISNPSEPVSVVDFQIAALDHIARVSPEQPVPRVVRTLEGRTRGTVALADGASHHRADADLPGRCPDPGDGAHRRAATWQWARGSPS